MKDINIVPLYAYRLSTVGGHTHRVSVPFIALSDFWAELKKLKEDDSVLEAHILNPASGEVHPIFVEARAVIAVEDIYGKASFVIEEQNNMLKAGRTKNAVKKAKADKKKRDEIADKTRKSAKKRTL